jgi:AraC-like DNA-binding protein
MARLDHSCATMHLSSRQLVGADRDAAMRELFGRGYLNIDIEFLTERQLLEVSAWQLPGVSVTSGVLTRARIESHDPACQADTVMFGGGFGSTAVLRCRGRELTSGSGEAGLFRGFDPMTSENMSGWSPRMLRIDASLIEGLLPDLDDRMMNVVRPDNHALALLYQYLPLVCTPAVMGSPHLAQAAAQHLVDLVVLAVGAVGEGAHEASARGLAAARSAQAMAWVNRRATDPALTVDAVARAHRVSARTIQELFHREGTSFSELVLTARLRLASRRLADPSDARTISAIAFAVGFNDLSYFNRRFRERFGATPSDVRAAARAGIQ